VVNSNQDHILNFEDSMSSLISYIVPSTSSMIDFQSRDKHVLIGSFVYVVASVGPFPIYYRFGCYFRLDHFLVTFSAQCRCHGNFCRCPSTNRFRTGSGSSHLDTMLSFPVMMSSTGMAKERVMDSG